MNPTAQPRFRKPRCDSRLKTLPESRQREIAERCREAGLKDVVAELKAQGLKTSTAALSGWLAWWMLRERLARNQVVVETLLEDLGRKQPTIQPEQLFDIGQSMFSALAIEQQDAKTWARTQKLNMQRRALEHDARRIAILESKAQQADQAAEVAASDLSPEQKQARYREIFGLASG